jgi:hypothetical protein
MRQRSGIYLNFLCLLLISFEVKISRDIHIKLKQLCFQNVKLNFWVIYITKCHFYSAWNWNRRSFYSKSCIQIFLPSAKFLIQSFRDFIIVLDSSTGMRAWCNGMITFKGVNYGIQLVQLLSRSAGDVAMKRSSSQNSTSDNSSYITGNCLCVYSTVERSNITRAHSSKFWYHCFNAWSYECELHA